MGEAMDLQPELPLTETTFYILLCLASEPRHGYAIMKEVERLSSGKVRLRTGTLYGAIKRLLEGGWIERVAQERESDSGRVRKSYRLTSLGRRYLEAEKARLESLVAVAQEALAGART
jgi:DNA-binding PadR family transcriptional regulator